MMVVSSSPLLNNLLQSTIKFIDKHFCLTARAPDLADVPVFFILSPFDPSITSARKFLDGTPVEKMARNYTRRKKFSRSTTSIRAFSLDGTKIASIIVRAHCTRNNESIKSLELVIRGIIMVLKDHGNIIDEHGNVVNLTDIEIASNADLVIGDLVITTGMTVKQPVKKSRFNQFSARTKITGD